MTQEASKRIYQKHVIGSGGRPRTVWYHDECGAWHQSYSQALKCAQRYDAAEAKRGSYEPSKTVEALNEWNPIYR